MYVDSLTLSEYAQIVGVSGSVDLGIQGTLNANEDSLLWISFEDCIIAGIHISLSVPPSGSDIILVLKKNGVSILQNTIVIPQGSSYVFVNTSQLLTKDVIAGDKLQVEVKQVGSTVPGSNINVQINYQTIHDPSTTLTQILNNTFFDSIAFTKALNINAADAVNTYEFNGYAEDRLSYTLMQVPAAASFGTISGDFVSGLRIKEILAYHNKTANTYHLNICIQGAYIPEQYFDDIYIESLGRLSSPDMAFYGQTQNTNMTTWCWNLTDDQFKSFKASPTDNIRIKKNPDLETTESMLIPCTPILDGAYRLTGFKGLVGTSNINYLSARGQIGMLLNNDFNGSVCRYLAIYKTSVPTNGAFNGTGEVLSVFLSGNRAKTFLGAVRIEGFGVFAGSASIPGDFQYLSDFASTAWYWTLSREQPYVMPKTAVDLTKAVVTIDTEFYTYNRSVTMGTLTSNSNNYKFYQAATGYQTGVGSISSRNWQGSEIINRLGVVDARANDAGILFQIAFDGQHNNTLFSWIDIDGFGRFYVQDAEITNFVANNNTRFIWHISLQKFTEWPSTSPAIMFYINP
jgi:hypothetical protein